MESRELGRSGIVVSRVILGCGNFGGVGSAPAFFGQGIPRDEAFRIMDAAWELGITTFDTADAYGGGRSETWIGEWLAAKGSAVRDAIAIQTKTFNPVAEGDDRGLSRARILRQIDTSLERLGVERVALYLAHEFDAETPQEETLRGVRRARSRRQGRAPSAPPTSARSSSRRRSSSPSSKGSRATSSSRTRSRSSTATTRRPCSPSAASTVSATRRSARSRAAGSRGSTVAARPIPRGRG